MANPFKEADKAKKKPAGNPHIVNANEAKKEENQAKEVVEQIVPVVPVAPIVPEVPEVPESKKETPEKEVPQKKKEESAGAKKTSDLLASLNIDKKAARTHAFYLTDANVEKLKKIADKQGISSSKLLDLILEDFLKNI